MFQLLKNPNFDFMGKRNLLLTISALLMVASVVVLAVRGINEGIEFTGGTEIQVKYAQTPNVGEIRSALGRAGIRNVHVTRIGDPEENEVYIRVGLTTQAEEERDDVAKKVVTALRPEDYALEEGAGLLDLNVDSEKKIREKLEVCPDLTSEEAATLATAISDRRREAAIFVSLDDLASVPGMKTEALDYLKKQAFVGPFSLRSQSYIGPAIGKELMRKALFAILGSLAGMLIYIWIRFQFQWGLAAVLALSHDSLLVLGLFSLFAKEMSLPVVAAFLTLIGYSVNDTVVVFDRIRENLRLKGSTLDLAGVVNLSINQMLSRTIITSGLTWMVVMGLALFGGKALDPFSFVLATGIVVGTYSSVYIASPVLVLWKQIWGKRSHMKASSSGERKRRAKKVRG